MVNKYFRKSVCSVLTAVTVMLGSANTAGLYLASAEEAVSEAEAATEQEKEEKQEDSEQEKELKALIDHSYELVVQSLPRSVRNNINK